MVKTVCLWKYFMLSYEALNGPKWPKMAKKWPKVKLFQMLPENGSNGFSYFGHEVSPKKGPTHYENRMIKKKFCCCVMRPQVVQNDQKWPKIDLKWHFFHCCRKRAVTIFLTMYQSVIQIIDEELAKTACQKKSGCWDTPHNVFPSMTSQANSINTY